MDFLGVWVIRLVDERKKDANVVGEKDKMPLILNPCQRENDQYGDG